MPLRQSIRSLVAAVAIVVATALTLPLVADAQTVGQGVFSGRSNHVTTGGVSLQKNGNSYTVALASNFNFDGAPDPKIGFGNNGRYDRSTTFTALRQNTGAQNYSVPASVNAGNYNEVWLWCERFNVPLGVARIK